MAYEKVIDRLRKRVSNNLTPVSRDELRHQQYGILWECYAAQFVLPNYTLEEKICYLTHRVDNKTSKPKRIAEIMSFIREASIITGGEKVGTCKIKARDIDVFLKNAMLAGYNRDRGNSISSVLYNNESYIRDAERKEEAEKQRKAEEREAKKAEKERQKAEREAKKAEREAKKAEREAEKERLAAYKKAIKKQRKRGQADAETRRRVSIEKEEKVHQLYRERHGHDTDRIPQKERIELYAEVRKATEERRRQEERDRSAKVKQQKQKADLLAVHKVRLHLNNAQKAYLRKCFGIARFCFNWAYDQWEAANRSGERVFADELTARFNAICKEQYPWTYEVTNFAKKTGFMAFDRAQQKMFDGGGPPQRKRYKLGTGSLHFVVTGKRKEPPLSDNNPDLPNSKPSKKRQYLFIPGLGYVKMMERLRFDGLLSSACVKLESDGHYYAVLNVYITRDEWKRTHRSSNITISEPLGIDVGIRDLAILSNGLCIDKHQVNERLRDRKQQLQLAIKSRKLAHPGHTSKKQKRLSWQLAKVKAKMNRQREDYYHKVSSVLANIFENICMENLNISTMIQNGEIPSHLLKEAALYRFRELMEQKAKAADHHLHLADKAYESTNICSRCGHKEPNLPLRQRIFRCTECGAEIDRDLNAAINLAKLIGMDEPNHRTAANGVTAALLTRKGISSHQATKGK